MDFRFIWTFWWFCELIRLPTYATPMGVPWNVWSSDLYDPPWEFCEMTGLPTYANPLGGSGIIARGRGERSEPLPLVTWWGLFESLPPWGLRQCYDSAYHWLVIGISPKCRWNIAEMPTEYRRESDGNSPKSRNGFAKPVISWYSLRSLRLCENEFSLSFS